MHSLILHSFNKSMSNSDQRTIHLEYSRYNLSSDLTWR